MKIAEVVEEIMRGGPNRSVRMHSHQDEFVVDVAVLGVVVFTVRGTDLEGMLAFVREQTCSRGFEEVPHALLRSAAEWTKRQVPSSLSPDWDPDVHEAPPGDY